MTPALQLIALLSLGQSPNLRLPEGVKPRHYVLNLTIVPQAGRFSGREVIDLDLAKPTKAITLHAVDLTLSDAQVTQAGTTVKLTPRADAATQTVTFDLPQELKPGLASLKLSFEAELRRDLRGLYLAKAADGTPEAFTQFESVDARKAFPCFDEPALKASFTLSVTAPRDLTVVSNTLPAHYAAQQTGLDAQYGPYETWVFPETLPLPTYLVALGVGRFDVLEGMAGKTPLRVLTGAGQKDLGRYALQAALAIVPWFERWFGVPFPYPKLDLVAVPEFEAGGMENAGAIFFRDTALLIDAAHAGVDAQQRVYSVIAHEIAHQWFGDLVTMNWWDDVWLNESFASLMQTYAMAELTPQWPMWEQFDAAKQRALNLDALTDTQAIRAPVNDPASGNATFPEIIYNKGEAVLHMMAGYMTAQVFRQGVHEFLVAHANANASASDFWAALSKASGRDIGPLANSWFDQAGYPLVTATVSGKPFRLGAGPDTRPLEIAQVRFLLSPSSADPAQRWILPICLKQAAQPSDDTCFLGGNVQPALRPGRWFDANAGGLGYYRVRYSDSDARALLTAADQLTASERLDLIQDRWALLRAGLGSTASYLAGADRLFALREGASFELFSAILAESTVLDFQVDPNDPNFAKWVRTKLAPQAKALGWTPTPTESGDTHRLRAVVLEALDRLGHNPAVAKEGAKRLAAYEKAPDSLDPSLVQTVLLIGARHGDAARWDDFRARAKDAKIPELRTRYEMALAAFEKPELLQKSLALVSTGAFPKQDLGLAVGWFLGNPAVQHPAWTFFKAHWSEIRPRLGPYMLSRSVFNGLGNLCGEDAARDVTDFFAKNPIPGADLPLRRAVESIRVCGRLQAHRAEVRKAVQ